MRRHSSSLVALLAASLVATPLAAQVKAGSVFRFTGVADAVDVGTPGVALDFRGLARVATSGNTGSFSSFNRPGRGGAQVFGSMADLLVGHGPQVVSSFVVAGGYSFDVAFLPSGGYGAEACYVYPDLGQQCTPYQSEIGDPSNNVGLSPFYVTNVYSGDDAMPITSIAAFDVVGTVRGPGASSMPFVGTISSTFVGLSYQEVLYGLEQYGLQGAEFTGTFVAGRTRAPGIGSAAVSTPEPSTYALVGGGLVALAGVARRRRRDR